MRDNDLEVVSFLLLFLIFLFLGIFLRNAHSQDIRLQPCPYGPTSVGVPCVAPEATAPVVQAQASPPPPAPLFTPDNVARDTPVPLLTFLNDRTRENAEAFLDWQAARLAAIWESQEILTTLVRERKAR
jgi:hypothetical protein